MRFLRRIVRVVLVVADCGAKIVHLSVNQVDTSGKGVSGWNESMPEEHTHTMVASASASNFDNSKFRQYNSFGTPAQVHLI